MKLKAVLLSLFFYSAIFSQTITGKVLDAETGKPLSGTRVYLVKPKMTHDTIHICYWSIYKYKIISETIADSIGEFKFSLVKNGKYNIVVSFTMPPIEKFGGACGVRDEIDSNIVTYSGILYRRIFQLPVTCPYDKTKTQLFCPICKKTDEVKEILFGLPLFTEDEHALDKYYLGGCVVDSYCNPTRHCKRCNKDF